MAKSPLTELGALKQRSSSKWRRFAPDVLPMHVAEMDYDIADNIKDLLLQKISASDIGYTGPVPEVAEGFVKFAAQRWGWQVDPKQIRLSLSHARKMYFTFRGNVKKDWLPSLT